MKVAMVDKCLSPLWYSWYLSRALSEQLPLGSLEFYAPKRKCWRIRPGNTVLKPTWSPWLFPFEIFKEVVRSGVDVVHIQFEFNTFGPIYTSLLFPLLLLLLRLTHAKIVVTVHSAIARYMVSAGVLEEIAPKGLYIPRLYGFIFVTLLALYRLIGALSQGLVVHNRTIERWLATDYKLNRSRIRVIPHGIDDDKPSVKPDRVSFWRGRLAGEKVVLFFGVLSPRKGLGFLLRAYADVLKSQPNSVLVIAGLEPPYYRGYAKELESLIEKLKLDGHALLTGFLPSEDVHALFSIASVVVLPYTYSIAASGPLSFAIQHGKPVVASNTEILGEELRDGETALLLPVDDVVAMSNAIETLLSDESLGVKLSRNLALKARKESWRRVAQMTVELYQGLLA